jgi:hypothetical protein
MKAFKKLSSCRALASFRAPQGDLEDILGSPLKLFDYMNIGRPIILRDLPTFRRFQDESFIYLCQIKDQKKFNEIINQLKDLSIVYSNMTSAHAYCTHEFDWQSQVEKYTQTLRPQG